MKNLAAICSVTALLFVPQANAQKMYRCGNVYQDRPCDARQTGRAIGGTGAAPPAAATPTKDLECRQRGADALKIVWMREAGKTKEQQVAEIDRKPLSGAKRDEESQLIESVYGKRGSATDIRLAVEAECAAEKDRATQAAALAAAAAKLQGGAPAAPSAAPGEPSEERLRAAEVRRREEIAAGEERARKSRCTDLAQQKESIQRQQRAGGSAAAMDRLNERRRDLEARIGSEGC